MEPNNLLNCIKAFAKRICATLLAALAVSLLTIGCGDRSAPDANNSDSTRINKLYNRENEMCIFSKRNVHFLYFFAVSQLVLNGILNGF